MILNKNIAILITLFAALTTLPQSFANVSAGSGYDQQVREESLVRTEQAGDRLFENGFYEDAIKTWREPYHFFRDNQDLSGQVRLLYKIATSQRQLGLHDRAVKGLSVAFKLLSLSEDPLMKLLVQANLAGAYLYAQDMKNARINLVEARNLARRANNKELLALINNDLGNFYLQTGQKDKALSAFEESYQMGKELPDSQLMLRAMTNAFQLMVNEKDVESATSYLTRALETVEQYQPSYQKSFGVIKLGEAGLRYFGEFDNVDTQLLSRLASLINTEIPFSKTLSNDWLTAQLYSVLAKFYEANSNYDNALTLANQALFHAQLINDSYLIYKLQWQAARIERIRGNNEKAIVSYQSAVETLQPIRHQLVTDAWHGGAFGGEQGNIYLELADLMLQKARGVSGNKSLASRLLKDTRNILESQKTAEVEDYFRDQCVVAAKALQVDIDEALDNETAVIYPVMLQDRTELLVSTSDGIRQYVVNETNDSVTRQVRNLRLKLEKRSTREYLPYAQSLYKTLITPIESDLVKHNIKTLVFIPGQSLRTIPITALHDGKQFLVDKYAIATTPGLTLTDPRPLKRERLKILLSGLSQPVQGYPPLTYVQNELHTIEDLYVSKTLLDNAFLKNSVSEELRDAGYGVAHFASHAEFTGDVRDSYILTYDDKLSVNQLGQLASLNQYRKKPIELLTLSACNTAAGDDRAALGLAGVAVQSGARSALASLWAINDKASSILVAEFYRQLLDENVTKVQALQRAQRKLMENVRYRHPGYWSPFLLIGNWL